MTDYNPITDDKTLQYSANDIKELLNEQVSKCTAAVDMAFYHANDHGYTEEETESHVIMMCKHAGDTK